MSCSPFPLEDYFLQELAVPQRLLVEAHIETCPPCREELERLQITQAALFTLRDEEIPRRIAFVSGPVLEPSAWRRRWAAFWDSGAQLGFASAAMLSAALVVFAITRPAPAPVVQFAPPQATVRAVAAPPAHVAPAVPAVRPAPAVTAGEMQARIDAAVAKAVAQVEARQQGQTRQILADLDESRRRLVLAAQEFDYFHRRESANLISAGLVGPPPERGKGESK